MRAGVVSTIVPVYNRARLLADAINSVLAQTYRPIEILIVDDGSTDDTPSIAQRFAAEHPEEVRYLRQPHAGEPYAGCARARNTGVAAATGEFVQLLDSDDLLMPDKFARQVAALHANPHCGVSYGYAREYAYGDPPRQQPARRTALTFERLAPELWVQRIWPSPSPLYRRSIVDAAGPFREVVNSDWEFECRVAALGVPLHHCAAFVADVRNTHALEARRRPGARRSALPRNVDAHEMMLASARLAEVPPATLSRFAQRVFALARSCAASGFEDDARRALGVGREIASPAGAWAMAIYAVVSDMIGWSQAGRWSEALLAMWPRTMRPMRAFISRWRHRAVLASAVLAERPLPEWPATLSALWGARGGRARATR